MADDERASYDAGNHVRYYVREIWPGQYEIWREWPRDMDILGMGFVRRYIAPGGDWGAATAEAERRAIEERARRSDG